MTRVRIGAMMLVTGAVAAGPPIAGAQEVERPRIGIAAGADVHGATGSTNVWLVQASAQWRLRSSGLGLRAELSYLERGREHQSVLAIPLGPSPCSQPAIDCFPQLDLGVKVRGIGAMVSGTFEFMRGASVRPYVVSGVGVLATRTRTDVEGGFPACPACDFAARPLSLIGVIETSQSATSMILNGGAGILFDIGRAQLFTELRYQLADQPTIRGLSGIAPLTLGIRF
jgi:hypothetical protein